MTNISYYFKKISQILVGKTPVFDKLLIGEDKKSGDGVS